MSEVLGPKLEISHLSKEFSRSASSAMPVLDDLSLAVADLEFVAIVGPSGCGKSTFLRIVDGLIPPDTGTIRLNGAPVNGPGHGRGMVFQSFDLFPWRTAIGNVEFGLEMQNLPRAERRRRAHHWIELVGLQGFENSYPHQLSGGMQQRVGIARALAIEEAIYLADRVLVFTPRPARIERVIDIPFGRPRREDMKSDPAFVELRRDIWQSLKQGVRV